MSEQQLALMPGATVTTRSLTLPPNSSFEFWKKCGPPVGICLDSGPFVFGDWLNDGIKNHGISITSFMKSEDAKRIPGLSGTKYDTLNSYTSVMAKIPKEYRVEGVSFAHHQTVSRIIPKLDAPEEERKQALIEVQGWLEIAKDKDLSLREMRLAISGRKNIADITSNSPTPHQSTKQQHPKLSIADIALQLHRLALTLITKLEDDQNPISHWTSLQKQVAQIALKPLMDDTVKLTDYYISLCKS